MAATEREDLLISCDGSEDCYTFKAVSEMVVLGALINDKADALVACAHRLELGERAFHAKVDIWSNHSLTFPQKSFLYH